MYFVLFVFLLAQPAVTSLKNTPPNQKKAKTYQAKKKKHQRTKKQKKKKEIKNHKTALNMVRVHNIEHKYQF